MKTTLIVLITLSIINLHAQEFDWATQMGNIGPTEASDVALDQDGNIYTAGIFYSYGDFDPGPDETILTSSGYSDIFISKVDAFGHLIWVRQVGGAMPDFVGAIAIDGDGNVLITGSFSGTVDFDPGVGSCVFTMDDFYIGVSGEPYLTGPDLYVCKLDTDGFFVWAKQIGDNLNDGGIDIAVDAEGNVYYAGIFSTNSTLDSTDVDPGPDIYYLKNGGALISKLDAFGNFQWARKYGKPWGGGSTFTHLGNSIFRSYSVIFRSIVLDDAGYMYIAGRFVSNNDFNPGEGVYELNCLGVQDAIISKLNIDGEFVWAKQIGGTDATAIVDDIAIDGSGNIHTTGYFIGNVDFNPNAGINKLKTNSTIYSDVFVSKLSTSGNYIWAKQLGGNAEDRSAAIALDDQGNVYTTGWFAEKADFNPANGKFFMTAQYNDIFISKLTSAGAFAWAGQCGGTNDDQGRAIALDATSNVVTVGYFNTAADMDPNSGIYNFPSSVNRHAYILKLSQGAALMPADPEIVTRSNTTEIHVFPNPAKEKVIISFDEDKVLDFRIVMSDMSGRQILTQAGTTAKGFNAVEFYFSNIPTGLYHLVYYTSEVRKTKLIVVE